MSLLRGTLQSGHRGSCEPVTRVLPTNIGFDLKQMSFDVAGFARSELNLYASDSQNVSNQKVWTMHQVADKQPEFMP